jgi:hypothetical protein
MKVIDEKYEDPESDPDQDLNPYLLVRGMNPWVRIRTKMSRIRTLVFQYLFFFIPDGDIRFHCGPGSVFRF